MAAAELTDRKIFAFWLPLATTWIMMSIEGPYLAAIVARLPSATENLAAYGLAFAVASLVESPVIMLLSTSIALVRDRESFLSLRRFCYRLSVGLTLVIAILAFSPLLGWLAADVLHLPENVVRLARHAVAFLMVWPGAIGYRRFYQGLLIQHHLTRWVAYGTLIRVVTMGAVALAAARFTPLEGALVGALGLSAGVVAEAAATRVIADRVVRRLLLQEEGKALALPAILRFYVPLAMTSGLAMAVQPVVTFMLGSGRMALPSLAVLPVVQAFSFLFRSFGLAYQEVGVALLTDRFESYRRLRDFGMKLALVASGALALIAFTPLARVWFGRISGLSEELTHLSIVSTRILTFLPALTVLLTVERALLIHERRTRPITGATLAEVVTIAVVSAVGIYAFDWIGVYAAVTALLLGRVAGNLFLTVPCLQAIERLKKTEPVTV